MANWDIAFEYLMEWEDSQKHPGVITTDKGGRTRFGIAERWHHSLTDTGFFDGMPFEQARQMAKNAWCENEWHLLQGDMIQSQVMANKMLSLSGPLGVPRIIRWAQEAAGVTPDGFVGTNTLRAWNANSASVLASVVTDALAQFEQDGIEQPGMLKGWRRRAMDSGEVTVHA